MTFDVSRVLGRRFALGLVLAGLIGAGVAVGCSSDEQHPAAPDAEAVCAATVADTSGHSCGVEGLRCYPEYPCGIFSAIATCICSRGRFGCTDVTGNALNPADIPPTCPPATDGGACPATRSAAELSPCAVTGLLCAYPSGCPRTPAFDTCECFPAKMSDGGVGLRFECSPPCMEEGGAIVSIDAPNDAPLDAPDAPGEAGPPAIDAATDARPRDGAAD